MEKYTSLFVLSNRKFIFFLPLSRVFYRARNFAGFPVIKQERIMFRAFRLACRCEPRKRPNNPCTNVRLFPFITFRAPAHSLVMTSPNKSLRGPKVRINLDFPPFQTGLLRHSLRSFLAMTFWGFPANISPSQLASILRVRNLLQHNSLLFFPSF